MTSLVGKILAALFDRPKDWVDIAAVVENGAIVQPAVVRRSLVQLVGPDDPRVLRWDALIG